MQMSVQDFSSTGPRWQSVLSIVLGSSLAILLNYIVSPELRTVGIASPERRTSATSATHFVLLGATGDLAVRYIFPALSATQKKNSGVVVYAASRQDSEHVRELLQSRLQKTKLEENSHFWENLRFRRLKTADDFVALCDSIPKNERIIFYLSIPPSGYLDTVRKVAEVCTGSRNEDKLRVVLEKPFGVDEVSAADLFRSLLEVLPEQNIYLVDHYKGW
jgi:glucose-6-phosphate 1-dehydrogenase